MDVIKFTDAVWERKGPSRHQKASRVGARKVTAEVIDTFRDKQDVWVILKIVQCLVIDDKTGGLRVHALKVREEMKRLRTSLVRWGEPKRLPWSDEGNRADRLADQEAPAFRSHRTKRQDSIEVLSLRSSRQEVYPPIVAPA